MYRDMTYIDDIVSGILNAIEYSVKKMRNVMTYLTLNVNQ